MGLDIIKKELNPLMSRIEVEGIISSDTTPSYEEAKKEFADKMNKNPELIVVKSIYQKYGRLKSIARAFIYENKESMSRFERKKEEKKENAEKPIEQQK